MNPWTDRHQIWSAWLRHGYLPPRKNWDQSLEGFRLPIYAKYTPHVRCAIRYGYTTVTHVYYFFGSSNRLQPWWSKNVYKMLWRCAVLCHDAKIACEKYDFCSSYRVTVTVDSVIFHDAIEGHNVKWSLAVRLVGTTILHQKEQWRQWTMTCRFVRLTVGLLRAVCPNYISFVRYMILPGICIQEHWILPFEVNMFSEKNSAY